MANIQPVDINPTQSMIVTGFCLTNYKSPAEWLQCPICIVRFHNLLPYVITNQKISHCYIFTFDKTFISFSDDLICDFQRIYLILFRKSEITSDRKFK